MKSQRLNLARSPSAFTRFAAHTSLYAGRPGAFLFAIAMVVAWAVAGPFFGFSDTWQLVINTATTLVTFLMVFVIQNSQNRGNEAIQIKLDELIRATEGAHNALLDLEEMEEEELEKLRARYVDLARRAREELKRGHADTDRPETS